VALAEAVGLPFTIKHLTARAPWRWLPPQLWAAPLAGVTVREGPLAPPWPRLVVSCGRITVAPALTVKGRGGRGTFGVHVQDPQAGRGRFDLIVASDHDDLDGPNVVTVEGALHRVTPERLQAAAAAADPVLAALPRPRLAVLVGGANRAYRFGPVQAARLGEEAAAMALAAGGSLMVTPSRRTGAEATRALAQAAATAPGMLWDGQGPNPYLAYLALADAIVVTEDSVSMACEAAATGKPVFVAALPGGSAKFRRFHARMAAAGRTRPFQGRLEAWSYAMPDEAARAGALVRARLAGGGSG
jgi:mitochondrial fission protein ELM1